MVESVSERKRLLSDVIHTVTGTLMESQALVARARGKPYLASQFGKSTIRGHLRTVALDFCAILALERAEWQQIENTAWPSGTFCRLDAFDPRLALGREPFRTSDRCKMPRSETYKWQATHGIEYNSGVRL